MKMPTHHAPPDDPHRLDLLDFLDAARTVAREGSSAAQDAEISATVTIKYSTGRTDTYTVPALRLDARRGDMLLMEHATPVDRVADDARVVRLAHTGEHIIRLAASLHLEPSDTPERYVYTLTRSYSCPECVQGKHGNCSGQALNPDTDEFVTCACAARGHA